jgi:glycosyltransferase involved in cell wall biosynthesis
MPRFAVVIPTYNRANALHKTLSSVLAQTFMDFEVIVVDDGSTDNTKAVVEEFHDPRVKYLFIENSGGPATPRNIGMQAATAEWISFLDSDDLWYPEKLETISQSIAENSDVDAIGNNEVIRDPASGKVTILRYGPVTPDFYRTLLVEGNRCSTSAMTVRKSLIEEHGLRFDTSRDFVIVEDYDFWMRLALHGARFRFLDVALGEYVLGDGNISANIEKSRRNWLRLLENHVFRIQQFEANREKLWREIQARVNATNAVADLRLVHPISFLRNAFEAVRVSPTGFFHWIGSRLERKLGRVFPGNPGRRG